MDVVDAGAFFGVEHRHYVDSRGFPTLRSVVRHPGAVAVVAVEDDHVWMIRQWRVAVDADVLEIPAGKRDVAGEPPEETARRECAEEIGRRPRALSKLVEFWNSPGFTDEHTIVYLAEELTEVERAPSGAEEIAAELERVPVADLGRRLAAGHFPDAKTALGLAMFLNRHNTA